MVRDMKKRYYIAYGSNLNRSQMALRCPDAKAAGTAVIEGYELLFKGSRTGAYLTIEKKKGGKVPVALWEVSREDEKRLDRYEGYPAFYYKKSMKVRLAGKTVDAFVYIMHEERKRGIPSRFYVETCIEGYDDFGFDIGYLRDAYGGSGGDGNEN